MLLKQGITGLHMGLAIWEPGRHAGLTIQDLRIRANPAIQKRGRRTVLDTLEPELHMGRAIRKPILRAGRTVPGLGLQPARSKSVRA